MPPEQVPAQNAALPSPESSPRQSLGDRVYNAVLDKIVRQEFPEAGRLPSEAELARAFGVSRPIVREALARLRDDGLVISRKGSGSYVQSQAAPTRTEIGPIGSVNEVLKCHDFRTELEAGSAAAAATNPDRGLTSLIRDALPRVQLETGDPHTDALSDFAFHLAVAEASGNPYYPFMMRSIRSHLLFAMTLGRQLGIRDPQARHERRQREHQAIYAAIVAGEADNARSLMRDHITESRRRLLVG